MVRPASSLVSTVDAAAVTMVLLAGGADRVTVIVSSDSTVESPLTLTTMVALVWPSTKLTVPVAAWPAARSVPVAKPLVPLMVQVRSRAPSREPVRLTV